MKIKELFYINLHDECVASISKETTRTGAVTYKLHWHDGVANDWTEEHETLSLALARLAVVSYCVENDDALFAHEPDEFNARGKNFLESNTVAWHA